VKTNITQPNPSLPYPPDDASDYEKLLHRTLNERIKDFYNRIDAVIPYTATASQVLTSNVAGTKAGNVEWLGVSPAFKNLLVDGGFEVWDGSRTLTLPALNGYTGCTMWSYYGGPGFAQYVISRVAGLTPASRYAIRHQRNALSVDTGAQYIIFDCESLNSLPAAGQTVTLSFTARGGANFSSNNNQLVQSYLITGTGTDEKFRASNYTGQVDVVTNHFLTTTATRYTVTTTLGAGINQVGLFFTWFPFGTAGANDYVEFDDVQLEIAPQATAFERLPWGEIRSLIARYYRKTFPYDTAPAQAGGLAGAHTYPLSIAAAVASIGAPATMAIQMRKTPVVTFYNPAAANAFVRNVTGATDATATATVNAGDMGFGITETGIIGWVVGDQLAVHYQADARI
jgi:hypothetical protein